jgi:hypothetical protein
MDKKIDTLLRQQLFGETNSSVYAVLDGAAIPDLLDMFDEFEPVRVCLLRGVDDLELAATAPYLVQLKGEAPFTEWLLAEGLGEHGGIFAIVPEGIPFIDLRKHFRDLVRVCLPEGETVLFRFYDPRVCNTFLPTCSQDQLQEFFGPVIRYLAVQKSESEDQVELIEYALENGVLLSRPVVLAMQG